MPNTRANLFIGEKLNGYIDETFINSLVVGKFSQNPIVFDTWNAAKTLAYWRFDDVAKPGKDSHSWLGRLENIRTALQGQPGNRKLRLGLAGGRWLTMVANETARANFAVQVKNVLDKYNLEGVDLDFEWPTSAADYANYSLAIVKLRQVLGADVCFSVSLHPVAFKISKAAIDAVDFISYQCYGPAVMRFPFSQFVSDGKLATDYGIPKGKLVMGVPFYGTTGSQIAAYYDFIGAGLVDTTLDEFVYKGGKFIFNSQQTIREKTQYVCNNDFGGIMSWDLATDMPVTHDKSLLKVVKEELDYYVNPPKK